MIKKKIITILLAVGLSICLFFSFGFQIDVSGTVSKDGGTADVSLSEPLRVAADEAKAALAAAELALEEAEADLIEAGLAVEAAVAALALAITDVDIATAELDLAEAELALAEAELAVAEAQAALAAAILAADEANAAYSEIKTKDAEELEALQLAVDEAKTALEEALAAGSDEEIVDELQQILDDANAAMEEGEASVSGSMYSHIITNSNNGGSFNIEGNQSGIDGDLLQYTFESVDGYDLVWLRVGNIKIATTDVVNLYDYEFNKKNLTIHAHFKKDKNYVPDEDLGSDENNGQGKKGNNGKKGEKGNNGKKK